RERIRPPQEFLNARGRNLLAWPIPVVYTRRIPAKRKLTRVTVGPFYTRRHKSTTPGQGTRPTGRCSRVPSRGGTFGSCIVLEFHWPGSGAKETIIPPTQ